MRIVIQPRVVQVISPEIVQYRCDRCGEICGTKENNKETWYDKGKSSHYCKKTCSPNAHHRYEGAHVMNCEWCLRDAEAENDPRIAEWTLMALRGEELNRVPKPVKGERKMTMKPVDQVLFDRTAPAWNCVSYPRDGMHYVGNPDRCGWCGMTREQMREEWRETSARWDRERELGMVSRLMEPGEGETGRYVCVPPLRFLGHAGCLHTPHITIRTQGVWVKSDRPDTLTGKHLWTSAHRDCYERWIENEGK